MVLGGILSLSLYVYTNIYIIGDQFDYRSIEYEISNLGNTGFICIIIVVEIDLVKSL